MANGLLSAAWVCQYLGIPTRLAHEVRRWMTDNRRTRLKSIRIRVGRNLLWTREDWLLGILDDSQVRSVTTTAEILRAVSPRLLTALRQISKAARDTRVSWTSFAHTGLEGFEEVLHVDGCRDPA